MYCLGIDTSNYATSAAVYDPDCGVFALRKDLEVKSGNLGLRQSDAVFLHVKNLPALMDELSEKMCGSPAAIAVSAKPRDIEGSYMPCFLAGVAAAKTAAAACGARYVESSHQTGHVTAAVWGANRRELYSSRFYSFHVSGGTTELLRCDFTGLVPHIELVDCTTDLNAGQCVDRVGLMLGLDFPAGKQLSELAKGSAERVKPYSSILKDGCSLSGLQNKCEKLLHDGAAPSCVARFCLESIAETLRLMLERALQREKLSCVMAGGVSSSDIVREYFRNCGLSDVSFAKPEFSCDNAAGTAILAQRFWGEC